MIVDLPAKASDPDAANGHPPDTPVPGPPAEVGEKTANPLPEAEKPAEGGGAERKRQEERLDHGLEETFPASDPVSVQGP